MKRYLFLVWLVLFYNVSGFAQIDKDQLALNVAKAEQANLEQLYAYIWKRTSNIFVENQLKRTAVTEFRFDKEGKIETTVIDSKSPVKQKPGVRGAMQKSAVEDKADYAQKALQLSVRYAFMSKGELVDFFNKATITEKDGLIEAVANSVLVPGDRFLMRIDPATNLIMYKEFSSLLDKDLIDGKLNYDKFSNGTVHGTSTILNLPVQKMRIDGLNSDYTIRVD